MKKSGIDSFETLTERFLRKARGTAKGVSVDGVSNALIIFGKCCSPIPGDDIIGYVTRGRGVTIHRSNCKNLPIKKNRDRIITVEWDFNSQNPFLVRHKLKSYNLVYLLFFQFLLYFYQLNDNLFFLHIIGLLNLTQWILWHQKLGIFSSFFIFSNLNH